jgi:predicted nucleotidyltransferase
LRRPPQLFTLLAPSVAYPAPFVSPVSCLPLNPSQHHPAADLAAERLRALAEQHLPHARLWIFGSRAKGTYFRRSDFDVAVEPTAERFTYMDFSRFLDAVEDDSSIPYKVDAHLFDQVPVEWRERIRREGIVWKN